MSFKIVNKDITSLNVDALVNSTNNLMYGFSGVDKRINDSKIIKNTESNSK